MPIDPVTVVRRFVDAFNAADLDTMAACLAESVVAGVTQPDASTVDLQGRDGYMAAIAALDIAAVRPRLTITQLVKISEQQVLSMIEVRATRKGRELHNHAAYLTTITDGLIQRIWMVEALPEESDTFWNR